MLRTRMKRLADRGELAVQRLADIETSILQLGDEDLLDLADIFNASADTPLGANGWQPSTPVDGARTSFHILTTGGILGRDLLSRD